MSKSKKSRAQSHYSVRGTRGVQPVEQKAQLSLDCVAHPLGYGMTPLIPSHWNDQEKSHMQVKYIVIWESGGCSL